MNFSKHALDALTALAADTAVDWAQFFGQDALNDDSFPASHEYMQPGALIAAVTNANPGRASILLTIGAKQEKRYALALFEDQATFLELDRSAKDLIQLDLVHMTGYPTSGYGSRTTKHPIAHGRRLLPLGPDDIKKWFANTSATRAIELLRTLRPVSNGLENWLRAACVAVDTDKNISQVQVEVTSLQPTDIPTEVWDQLKDEIVTINTKCPQYGAALESPFSPLFPNDDPPRPATPPPPPEVPWLDIPLPVPEAPPRPEQPRPALKRKGRWETGPSVPRYGSSPQPAPFVITPNPSPDKTDFQLKYEALRAKACSNQRLSP